MKNNKNLNPLNDPEVAKMLTMSPEDQLWSFLDDCVPYDGKDAVLVMMGDFDAENKNEDGNVAIKGVPYCAMITDLIFEKSEEVMWECRVCGHLVVGKKAPEVCPVCSFSQSYFEVRKENY